MKMNPYLMGFCLLFLMASCGNSDNEPSGELSVNKIQNQLNEKRKALRSIKAEIKALEVQLKTLKPELDRKKLIPVTVQKIQTKDFSHYVEVQGNVMAAENPAMASSETGGRITELTVKEGDFVRKGTLLAKVNLESIKKSIAQLDESLKLAEDIFNRQENLWKQKIGSEVQYLQAKSQFESLKKNKESLEFELTKANVFAPADGYVDMIFVKTGEMSGPGTPILQLINTKKLKVVAEVPEVYLGKIRKGDLVNINYPALGENNQGKVTMIGRSIHPANRTFSVEASINSKNDLLKPNLLATVKVEDYAAKNAIVIPDQLILQDISGNNYIMVAEGNIASKKNVVLGKGYDNETIIQSGLNGDETLIIKGARQVSDGDELKIIDENSQTDQ